MNRLTYSEKLKLKLSTATISGLTESVARRKIQAELIKQQANQQISLLVKEIEIIETELISAQKKQADLKNKIAKKYNVDIESIIDSMEVTNEIS